MDVICPKCSTHHRAEPPSSLRARGAVRFRCTHCGNTFRVEFPSIAPTSTAAMTLAPLSGDTPSVPVPLAPLPTGYTVRAEGEVYPTTDLATLQRWILECRVKPDDQLSVDGERWERAGERPDLELFFAAAERLHLPVPHTSLPPVAVAPSPPPEDPLAADPSNADTRPSRDDADVVTTLGGGDPDESEVDAVEDMWGDRTQPQPGPPSEELPRIEPDEITRISSGEPDTQEATMLSVLQERTEEIRKGPVPVRRGYTSLSGQSIPPPGQSLPPAPGVPQSFQEMAAEFDVPRPRVIDPPPVFEPFDDEPPPPSDNRVAGILAVVGGVVVIGIIATLGWHFTHTPAEPPAAKQELAATPPAPEPVVAPVEAAPPVDAALAGVPTELDAALAGVPTEPVAAVAPTPVAEAPKPVVEAPKPVAEAPKPAPKPTAVAAPPPTTTSAGPLSANEAVKKGWSLANKGKYSEAFDVFSKALQRNRSNGDLLYGRGYANEKLGDDVSAAADYCDAKKAAISEDIRRELDGALGRLHRTCP